MNPGGLNHHPHDHAASARLTLRFFHAATLGSMAIAIAGADAATILDPLDAPAVEEARYRERAGAFPQVGMVTGGGLTGSGVFLGGRWVLTAGHVAFGKAGGTVVLGGVNYTVAEAITHPDFSFTTLASDIGLLLLTSDVANVTAAILYDFPDPSDVRGLTATWVGHGLGGTGRTGEQLPPAARAFTNVIDVVGTLTTPPYTPPATAFLSDFDQPGGAANAPLSDPEPTELEGGLAAGDSGGGVFVRIDGVECLVGINSYQAFFTEIAPGAYGTINGATNLDHFLPWIDERTGLRPIPEPAATLLLLMGAMMGLRRRRTVTASPPA